ncbi:mitochondrial outer membrane protein SLC25A46-like [Montipora foliosa]|uniref:mitochondrial outer membrane protein SLC25A46-like n=1 Tax=Montipora foliosa TaxID=591990 RepID=UPI0035F156A0
MVYDKFKGIEQQSMPLSRQQTFNDEESVAQANVVNCVDGKTPREHQIESTQRLIGFAIGTGSILAAQFVTHPFTVFRRQCQVNHGARKYHLSPFTVFQILIRLERSQGYGSLWKGCGSTYVVSAVNFFSEAAISSLTHLPQDAPNRKSSCKDLGGHLLLKGLSLAISMPVAAASLTETVKSDLTRDQDNMIESLKDWMYRVVGWDRSSGRHGRLLPMWTLVLPTVLHGLLSYVLGTLIQHLVLMKLKGRGLHSSHDQSNTSSDEEPPDPTDMTQTYYPELVANFLALFVPEILLYPLQTVLNQLYVQGTRTIVDDLDSGSGVVPLCTNYDGVMDCFHSIWRDEGLGGFYKGFGALLIQLFIHWVILKLTQFVYREMSQDFKGK